MIIVISDFSLRGSGYMTISTSLCMQLAKHGYEIKALGLGYKHEEHNFPFSIIPVPEQSAFSIANVMLTNLLTLHGVETDIEAVIVPLDIPMQEVFLESWERKVPYIGIFPLESPPLCNTWAALLRKMDARLVISEFGTKAVNEAGVSSRYLPVGIDFDSWRAPSEDERKKLRATMGFEEDEFVVLTVADNQERKNLGSAFQMISEMKKRGHKVRWILVSRINFKFGWFVHDLAMDLDISDILMPFERGIDFKKLWALYSVSDAFLLTSKAEGLGMPVLEAMAMRLPVVATDHTAMADHQADGRGFPIEPYAWFIDPFGNSRRCYPSVESGVKQLESVKSLSNEDKTAHTDRAFDYVKSRTWEEAGNILLEEFLALRSIHDQTKAKRTRSKVAIF